MDDEDLKRNLGRMVRDLCFLFFGVIITFGLTADYYRTEGVARGYAVYGDRIGVERDVIWLPASQIHEQYKALREAQDAGSGGGSEKAAPVDPQTSTTPIPDGGIHIDDQEHKTTKKKKVPAPEPVKCSYSSEKQCCVLKSGECVEEK